MTFCLYKFIKFWVAGSSNPTWKKLKAAPHSVGLEETIEKANEATKLDPMVHIHTVSISWLLKEKVRPSNENQHLLLKIQYW